MGPHNWPSGPRRAAEQPRLDAADPGSALWDALRPDGFGQPHPAKAHYRPRHRHAATSMLETTVLVGRYWRANPISQQRSSQARKEAMPGCALADFGDVDDLVHPDYPVVTGVVGQQCHDRLQPVLPSLLG